MVAHQLTRWASTELNSGGNPCIIEYFPDLSWLYVGTDSLNVPLWLIMNKTSCFDFFFKKSKFESYVGKQLTDTRFVEKKSILLR